METTAVYNNEDLLKVKLEITVSAPMKDWMSLNDQLSSERWPVCDLKTQIKEAITLARQVFTVKDK